MINIMLHVSVLWEYFRHSILSWREYFYYQCDIERTLLDHSGHIYVDNKVSSVLIVRVVLWSAAISVMSLSWWEDGQANVIIVGEKKHSCCVTDIDDISSQLVPLWPTCRAEGNETNSNILAYFSSKLAYMSLLFILHWTCNAGISGQLKNK